MNRVAVALLPLFVLAGLPFAYSKNETSGTVKPKTDATTVPTYTGQVASLLNQNCVSCHRKGAIGPMSFATYEEAKKFAGVIASVTETRQMPPWKPVKGHGDFKDERLLSENDIQTLKAWSEAGAPIGNPNQMPAAPQFAEGWRLGTPDLILKMPKSYRVEAVQEDVYRCFVLPTGLTEDKQVVAVEYKAGNPRVVHHVLGYIDVNGAGKEKDAAEEGFGYTSFGGPGFMPYGELGGWAPGNLPQFLPDGVGRHLPANSDIVMQVHYHASGKPEEDITEVGLYFAKKPVEKQFRVAPVVVRKLSIPPGEANHTVTATYPVPTDATVLNVTPHMHLLGRKIEMSATLPDGKAVPLIKIDDWDFKWQDSYAFKEPIRLPKGSKVTLTATYDNSIGNPRNPNNPPKEVTWGEATTDEMCIGFLGFIADNENDPMIKLFDRLRQQRGGDNKEGNQRLQKAVEEILGAKKP